MCDGFLISIVMPLYNKAADVELSVKSVLAQTVSDFELIVVNDGSTDSGPSIVRNIIDRRIRVYDQTNQGVSAARNRAIQLASSDLIAFLDADDLWETTFLETIVSLRNKFPSCSVFATNYSYLETDGSTRLPVIKGLPLKPWQGVLEDYFAIAAQSDPLLWSSALAVEKSTMESIGGFPLGVKSGEDLLTWARLAIGHKIAYDTRPLAIFRQRTLRNAQPTRVPEYPDSVGGELELLKNSVLPEQKKAFYHYIAWWHKNRANMYLRLAMKREAVYEVGQMGRHRFDRKFCMYLVCLLIPSFFTRKLFLLWGKR